METRVDFKCCGCPDSTASVASVTTAVSIGGAVAATGIAGTFATSPSHGADPE